MRIHVDKLDYHFELYDAPFCKECIDDNDMSACNDTTLMFRTYNASSRDMISLNNAIGIDKTNVLHNEFTSRPLHD